MAVYLTPTGRASNVKLTMLEAIGKVAHNGKLYNRVGHLTETLKTNYK
jgi:hypothetical protein